MKYYRDTYAEHPDDRENIEYSVFLEHDDSLVTLSGMYEQLKEHGFNLAYARFGFFVKVGSELRYLNYRFLLIFHTCYSTATCKILLK